MFQGCEVIYIIYAYIQFYLIFVYWFKNKSPAIFINNRAFIVKNDTLGLIQSIVHR